MMTSSFKNQQKFMQISFQQLEKSVDNSLIHSQTRKEHLIFDPDAAYFRQTNPEMTNYRKQQLSSIKRVKNQKNYSGFENDISNTSFNLMNINSYEIAPIIQDYRSQRQTTQRNTSRKSQNVTVRLSNKILLEDELSTAYSKQQIQKQHSEIKEQVTNINSKQDLININLSKFNVECQIKNYNNDKQSNLSIQKANKTISTQDSSVTESSAISSTSGKSSSQNLKFNPDQNEIENQKFQSKRITIEQSMESDYAKSFVQDNLYKTQVQEKICVIPKDKINFVVNLSKQNHKTNNIFNSRISQTANKVPFQNSSFIQQKTDKTLNTTHSSVLQNHFNLIKRKKKKSLSTSVSVRPSSSEQMTHKQLLLDNPAPFVSAQSWAMLDKNSGEVVFGRNENDQRQVASLTKIMTAYVVLDILQRYKINEHQVIITVLPQSARLIGTSANLMENEKLSVWELLHAMMLPSGNDAAQSLGIYFGLFLLKEELKQIHKTIDNLDSELLYILKLNQDNFSELEQKHQLVQKALSEFYKSMNREAMYLQLKNTHFSSVHGMFHEQNYSSAADIAKLSFFAMKNLLFRQIVKTQKYTCESRINLGHLYHWQNTNKLLEHGYSGLKTGITPAAGPCLAASIIKNEFKFIIIVLNSRSMEQRWVEVQKLVQWAILKINKIKHSDLKPKVKRKLLKKLLHI
eukprot:403334674